MSVLDWCITLLPVAFVLGLAYYSGRYIRSVADFVVAGRLAGRYVLTNGGAMASLSIISLVALVESKYQVGYGVVFWEAAVIPFTIFLALAGYITYRFRRTNSMSQGQFLELRYSRNFRIFASFIRILAEMLVNAIGPAIAANFFIYILDLPRSFLFFGIRIQTYALIVIIVLILALFIVWVGGKISLLITDAVQGILSFPILVVISCFLLYKITWGDCIAPVLTDRVPGESFVNPFDVSNLRNFNLFSVIVGLVTMIFCSGAYIGNDSSCSGRTPHEQKMAGILGTWRVAVTNLVQIVLVVAIIGLMTHQSWAPQAREIRSALSRKVAEEVVADPVLRGKVVKKVESIPQVRHRIGIDKPFSQAENIDNIYLDSVHEVLKQDPNGNMIFQKFRASYNQMMMPISIRKIFPPGMIGLFCLLMIMLLVTTDDSRIINASNAITQDLIVPYLKKSMTPKTHLLCLRLTALGVALFFLAGALFFSQLDYILLFLSLLGGIWMGGCGPVITFGLYGRFGNTAGAYASIITGSGISIAGLVFQRNWADIIYPFLSRRGWVEPIGAFLERISSPFHPYIVWKMDPVTFPINAYENFFLAMLFSTIAYIGISLLTSKRPFNLDRMLHRGKYAPPGEIEPKMEWTFKGIVNKLLGITPEYTRGDKILTWSVLSWTLGVKFGICFLGVLIWNFFSPWTPKMWTWYFFIYNIIIAMLLSIITMFWFGIGGVKDCIRLFRDLNGRVDNPLDNGRVEGRVSLADKGKWNDDDDGSAA